MVEFLIINIVIWGVRIRIMTYSRHYTLVGFLILSFESSIYSAWVCLDVLIKSLRLFEARRKGYGSK